MEQSEFSKRNCENCKHYHKHYGWSKTQLIYVYSGHCFTNKLKRLVSYDKYCDNWEENTTDPTEQTEDIKRVLKRAAKQINEIALLLKFDN